MVPRWLLHRSREQFCIVCTSDLKPVKGDWNGTPWHYLPIISDPTLAACSGKRYPSAALDCSSAAPIWCSCNGDASRSLPNMQTI